MDDECKLREKYTNTTELPVLSSIDEFGFLLDNFSISDQRFSSIDNILTKNEWYSLLDKSELTYNEFKGQIKNKKLLQRGVPVLLRPKIWKRLLYKEKEEACSNYFYIQESLTKINLGQLYHRLGIESIKLKQLDTIIKRAKYTEKTKKKCGYEHQIHVDIQRTFRRHFLFHQSYGKGQTELFNMLVAFANQFKEIGYCQGLSDIAAIFLMQFEEYEAFESMVCFFRKNKLFDLFDNKFSKLPKIIKKQIKLFKLVIPEIYINIERYSSALEMPLLTWYLTFFTRFNIKLCLRIWDYMMCYGYECCLYFVCALFKSQEINLKNINEEKLATFLSNINFEDFNENDIVDLANLFMLKANMKYLE